MSTSSLGEKGKNEVHIPIPEGPIQERVRSKSESLEADFSKLETKIHRFPPGLLRAVEDRYVVPSFVAIGPYHHGSPHLQHMEDVKHAAAHYFCQQSEQIIKEVYGKIFDIADQARSCYADEAVAHLGKDDLAEMMFLDGCFLLMYMSGTKSDLLLNRMTLSTGPCMLRDIFLLENQLPWLVVDELVATFPDCYCNPYEFVAGMAGFLDNPPPCFARPYPEGIQGYRPPHLLGLLRYYLCGAIMHRGPDPIKSQPPLSSSAIELAEIGVELTASDKPWFADMSFQTDLGPFPRLPLTPLFLNDFTACWLVNMAAYEACISGIRISTANGSASSDDGSSSTANGSASSDDGSSSTANGCWLVNMAAYKACISRIRISTANGSPSSEDGSTANGSPSEDDGFLISSYISLLAMLIDKEEDVHEMRAKHIVQSFFSNYEVLVFFKGLSRHLRLGQRYFVITENIEEFKRKMPVRIALHRFIYNNFKTIVALFSIASVLVGIFRTLMNLKQHQQ